MDRDAPTVRVLSGREHLTHDTSRDAGNLTQRLGGHRSGRESRDLDHVDPFVTELRQAAGQVDLQSRVFVEASGNNLLDEEWQPFAEPDHCGHLVPAGGSVQLLELSLDGTRIERCEPELKSVREPGQLSHPVHDRPVFPDVS